MGVDDVVCTAQDRDWGDDQPNLLMHPPCACPRCAPEPVQTSDDDGSWLRVAGRSQRLRVEPAELGAAGRATLG